MNRTDKGSNSPTLSKTKEKLTKTPFNWDTTDLEQEVFNNGKS